MTEMPMVVAMAMAMTTAMTMTTAELSGLAVWFVPAVLVTVAVERTLYGILIDGFALPRRLQWEAGGELERLRWECLNGIEARRYGPGEEPKRLTEDERQERCRRMTTLMAAEPVWRRLARYHLRCAWCRMLAASVLVSALLPVGASAGGRAILALAVPVCAVRASRSLLGEGGWGGGGCGGGERR